MYVYDKKKKKFVIKIETKEQEKAPVQELKNEQTKKEEVKPEAKTEQ